jgi:hypothetical protein
MNTAEMNRLLFQVSQAHRLEFIVMVVDGARCSCLGTTRGSRVVVAGSATTSWPKQAGH